MHVQVKVIRWGLGIVCMVLFLKQWWAKLPQLLMLSQRYGVGSQQSPIIPI